MGLFTEPFQEKRLMSQARKPSRLRRPAASFPDCLREFLTPAVWKQVQNVARTPKRPPRWSRQALLLVLLFTTWSCGDSQAERFETARAFCVVCLPKRKRPGKTLPGFQQALVKLPMPVLWALAGAVRRRLASLLHLWVDGFIVLGCDGSRLECPRSEILEQRLGQGGKNHSAPTVWVTALVHLRLGVLWSWRLGKGTASERAHLVQLLPTLPAAALLVADAGFNGFQLVQAILAANASFLIRMSSKVSLYAEVDPPAKGWRDGLVRYWPRAAQQQRQLPIRLRLIRLRGKKRRQDVWLLTNVLDPRRLPLEKAAQYYRWRWENEGLFRTYKRTLKQVKLHSRTPRLLFREAEGSLLATQLLLAQGARALSQRPQPMVVACSPRKVLLAIRQELYGLLPARQRHRFAQRLAAAQRERRPRQSSKVKRKWPRRGDHKAPKPPNILKLTRKQLTLISRLKQQRAD
jgi:hypothetical protein